MHCLHLGHLFLSVCFIRIDYYWEDTRTRARGRARPHSEGSGIPSTADLALECQGLEMLTKRETAERRSRLVAPLHIHTTVEK